MEEDLLECVQGLGTFDEDGIFQATLETRGCLSDIEYMIKRDNPETRMVYITLGKWEIVQGSLVPLAVAYREDKLFFYVVRLLVRLTMPLPENTSQVALQISHLQKYKVAFLESDILPVLVRWIQEPLAKPDSTRTSEDLDRLELFLTLCVNLLKIPDPASSSASTISDNWTHLQDRTILRFHEEAILDIFVVIGSTLKGSKYALLMLDILHHLFERENPEKLVYPEDSTKKMEELVLLEENKKRARAQSLSSRHPRFGSQFALRHALNKGSMQIVSNLFDSKRNQILNKGAKKKTGRGNMRGRRGGKLILDRAARSYYDDNVPRVLAECLEKVIDTCFAPLMDVVQQEVMERLSSATIFPEDTRNYMAFAAMCIGFKRLKMYRERRDYEKLFGISGGGKVSNKGRKKTPSGINDGDGGGDDKVVAKVDESGTAEAHRREKENKGCSTWGVVDEDDNEEAEDVDKNGVRRRRRYKYDFRSFFGLMDEHIFKWIISKVSETLDLKPVSWEKLEPAISMFLNMLRALHDMVAYGDRENRKIGFRVQRNLFYQDTVLTMLMKLVREYRIVRNRRSHLSNLVKCVYYVLRMLGKIDDSHASEFLMKTRVKVKKSKKKVNADSNELEQQQQKKAVTEEEYVEKEFTFEMNRFIASLAHPVIISNYFLLLRSFEDNSEETNDCICRFFQRLAFDLRAVPVFFQLSYLMVFEAILNSKVKKKTVKKLKDFAKYVIAKFAKVAKRNRIVFMELCFLKTLGVCESIYHPEKEVRTIAEKAKQRRIKMQRDRERAEREMLEKGREMHEDEETLDDDGVEKLEERARKAQEGLIEDEGLVARPWSREEDEILKENFDYYKHLGEDGIEILTGMLSARTSFHVKKRLRKLKLKIPKQKKKDRRKSMQRHSTGNVHSDGDDDDDDGISEEEMYDDDEDISDGRQIPILVPHDFKNKLNAALVLSRHEVLSLQPQSKDEKESNISSSSSRDGDSIAVINTILAKLKRCIGVWEESKNEEQQLDDGNGSSSEENQDDFDTQVADFPLIPLTEEEFHWLEMPLAKDLLTAAQFKPPDIDACEIYWRVSPTSISAAADSTSRSDYISNRTKSSSSSILALRYIKTLVNTIEETLVQWQQKNKQPHGNRNNPVAVEVASESVLLPRTDDGNTQDHTQESSSSSSEKQKHDVTSTKTSGGGGGGGEEEEEDKDELDSRGSNNPTATAADATTTTTTTTTTTSSDNTNTAVDDNGNEQEDTQEEKTKRGSEDDHKIDNGDVEMRMIKSVKEFKVDKEEEEEEEEKERKNRDNDDDDDSAAAGPDNNKESQKSEAGSSNNSGSSNCSNSKEKTKEITSTVFGVSIGASMATAAAAALNKSDDDDDIASNVLPNTEKRRTNKRRRDEEEEEKQGQNQVGEEEEDKECGDSSSGGHDSSSASCMMMKKIQGGNDGLDHARDHSRTNHDDRKISRSDGTSSFLNEDNLQFRKQANLQKEQHFCKERKSTNVRNSHKKLKSSFMEKAIESSQEFIVQPAESAPLSPKKRKSLEDSFSSGRKELVTPKEAGGGRNLCSKRQRVAMDG